jgi:hypothetical protein
MLWHLRHIRVRLLRHGGVLRLLGLGQFRNGSVLRHLRLWQLRHLGLWQLRDSRMRWQLRLRQLGYSGVRRHLGHRQLRLDWVRRYLRLRQLWHGRVRVLFLGCRLLD